MKSTQNARFAQSFHENEKIGSRPFPEEFPIDLTHNEFPASVKALSEMEMPLGLVTRPLVDINYANMSRTIGNLTKNVKEIARCAHCGAYINPYCEANSSRWYCSVCGKRNAYTKAQIRYRSTDHKHIPELRDLVIDYNAPIVSNNKDLEYVNAKQRPFIHLFLIQENMKIDTLQTTIDSILSSLDSLHPDMHVMLLTFSHRIGVFNLNDSTNFVPVVQYTHFLTDNNQVFENSEESMNAMTIDQFRLSIPLNDIGSFLQCSCRIGDCRETFENAVSSILEALPSNDSTDERNDIRTLLPVLQSINTWIHDEIENLVSSKNDVPITSLVPEPPTLFNTFDFSKLWHFLPAVDNEKKQDSALHNLTNLYHGIRMHIFIDSPQYPLYSNNISTKDASQALQRALLLLIHQFQEKYATCNIYSICAFETNQTNLWNWLYLITSLAGECYRFTLGHSELLEMEKLRFVEILQRQFAGLYASKLSLKLRLPRVLQLISTTIPSSVDSNQLSALSSVAKVTPLECDGISSDIKVVTPASAATAIMQHKTADTINDTANIPVIDPDRVYHFPMVTSDYCCGFRFKYNENLSQQDLETNEYEMHYGKGSGKNHRNNSKSAGEVGGLYIQIACVYEQLVEMPGEDGFNKDEDDNDTKSKRNEDESSMLVQSDESGLEYLVHACKGMKYPIVNYSVPSIQPQTTTIPPPPSTTNNPAETNIPEPQTVPIKSNKILEAAPIASVALSNVEEEIDTPTVPPTVTETANLTNPEPQTTQSESTKVVPAEKLDVVLADIDNNSVWKELKKHKPSIATHAHSYHHPFHRLQPQQHRNQCPFAKSKKLAVKKFIRIITVGIDCTSQQVRLQQVQQHSVVMALLLQEAMLASVYASFYTSTAVNATVSTVSAKPDKAETTVSVKQPNALLQLLSVIQDECIYGQQLLTILVRYLSQHYQYYLQSYQHHHNRHEPGNNDGYEDYEDHNDAYTTMPSPNSASKETILEYILQHHRNTRTIVNSFFAMFIKLLPSQLNYHQDHQHHQQQQKIVISPPRNFHYLDDRMEWLTVMHKMNPHLISRNLSPQLYTIAVNDDTLLVPVITNSISLRRDQMILSNCSQFLLDTGVEVIHYNQSMNVASSSMMMKTTSNIDITTMDANSADHEKLGMSTNSSKRRNSRTSSSLPKLLPVLHTRLYEQPVTPRMYCAQAGTISATYFTSNFLDDPMNTLISYPEFIQLLADMIIP